MIFFSFFFFLLIFVLIGILSTLKNRQTVSDYFLASHSQKPWMIALAAVATNNSGYMFIGMIGYSYLKGIAAFWIMIFAIFGDFCASLFVHKKLRIAAAESHSLSFSEVISKWGGANHNLVRIVSASLIVIFLGVYASAQLRAGGKALYALFGWDYSYGALISAAIVLFYCFLGGIRASIWINTVQSFVMIASMALLFFAAVSEIGGFHIFINKIENVSPSYANLIPDNLFFNPEIGFILFLIGCFFNGFGIIGQPHVMTSFMALRRAEDVNKIRIYYYSWYIIFFALTIATGLASRILIPFDNNFDVELSLPILSKIILPDILIGFILAGIFSSTMSTADSQILACSAAITNDIIKQKTKYFFAKIITVLVTIFAALIAISNSESVFFLANLGWLALACSFSPVIVIYALGGKLSQKLVLTMMFTGFITMLFWRYYRLEPKIYDAAPAIIAGIVPYFIAKLKFHKMLLQIKRISS